MIRNFFLPLEILTEIASYLPAKDLGNFRATSKYFASASFKAVFQNGIVIPDTSTHINEFLKLSQDASLAASVKKVTFISVTWLIFSRSDWDSHQKRIEACFDSHDDAGLAFNRYLKFILEENLCDYVDEFEAMVQAFNSLVNLDTMVIKCQSQYLRSKNAATWANRTPWRRARNASPWPNQRRRFMR
jgi:hypothetical protein